MTMLHATLTPQERKGKERAEDEEKFLFHVATRLSGIGWKLRVYRRLSRCLQRTEVAR